jgi:hypothetical protein
MRGRTPGRTSTANCARLKSIIELTLQLTRRSSTRLQEYVAERCFLPPRQERRPASKLAVFSGEEAEGPIRGHGEPVQHVLQPQEGRTRKSEA